MELACRAFAFLANGSGAIDWAGLAVVVQLLGVQDLEALLWNLLTIKTHKSPTDAVPDGAEFGPT